MSRLLYFLLALTLLLVPRAALAQAPAGGVIEGEVTMASGEPLPANLQAELLFLPNQQGPPRVTPQPLSSDGRFRFEVDPDPAHLYFVRVQMGENSTVSDPITFTAGEATRRVTLALAERTTDASALSLSEVNYILDPVSTGWMVVALYRYQNAGDREILNSVFPPAFIPLPDEATGVRFATDLPTDSVQEAAGGFSYGGPFPPGGTPFIFSYELPYNPAGQTIRLPVAPEAQRVLFLVAESLPATVSGLTRAGSQEGPEGRPFVRYESEGAPEGGALTVTFSSLPPLPTPSPEEALATDPTGAPGAPRIVPLSPLEQLPRWAALIPALLTVVAAVLYIARRPAPSRSEERASLRTQRERLIAEIASLDIRHESGGIGAATYRRQRERLVRDLKALLRQEGAESGAPRRPSPDHSPTAEGH